MNIMYIDDLVPKNQINYKMKKIIKDIKEDFILDFIKA